MPANTSINTNTLIVGAGAAGLAVGACLYRRNIPFVIVEKESMAGSAWLKRYDRLHLHTHRRFSALPFHPFPRSYPVYPSSRQFADYLAAYTQKFELAPVYNTEVTSADRHQGMWTTTAREVTYYSHNLVIATGQSNTPNVPTWPGMDSFTGSVTHSASYTNGASYKGKHVLVVGFGNSAGEIAIDLHEHGASVSMSVRSPVNVVPRDIFGLSTHAISVIMSRLPTEVADALSGTLRRAVVGNLESYGLKQAPMGPLTQIKRTGRTPLLDIGTVALIKAGSIRVLKEIKHFEGENIVFTDETQESFDAVILATGFHANVGAFLNLEDLGLDPRSEVSASGVEVASSGLYFCGYRNAPAGILREIGIEARRIARNIEQKKTSIPDRPIETTS